MARWHENLFSVIEDLGTAYVKFSPTANGFLTGRYSENSVFEQEADYRSNMPQYTAEGFERGRELLMSGGTEFITGSTFLIDGGAITSCFYEPPKPMK